MDRKENQKYWCHYHTCSFTCYRSLHEWYCTFDSIWPAPRSSCRGSVSVTKAGPIATQGIVNGRKVKKRLILLLILSRLSHAHKIPDAIHSTKGSRRITVKSKVLQSQVILFYSPRELFWFHFVSQTTAGIIGSQQFYPFLVFYSLNDVQVQRSF